MDLHKIFFTSIIASLFFMTSCKTSSTNASKVSKEIFSLNTTSCMGKCPVYEVKLYGDKTLTFKGEENTTITGEHSEVLSDEDFDALLAIIEAVNWSEYESKYTSYMSDLPTHNYKYSRNGRNKKISKYGNEPKELSEMNKALLIFVEGIFVADN